MVSVVDFGSDGLHRSLDCWRSRIWRRSFGLSAQRGLDSASFAVAGLLD